MEKKGERSVEGMSRSHCFVKWTRSGVSDSQQRTSHRRQLRKKKESIPKKGKRPNTPPRRTKGSRKKSNKNRIKRHPDRNNKKGVCKDKNSFGRKKREGHKKRSEEGGYFIFAGATGFRYMGKLSRKHGRRTCDGN